MFARPAAGLEGTPRGEEAQALLRSCVHCGFCLPACPTYRVTGNELDSPRGRIYLIKQLVEGCTATALTREHLDRCLTCRACERACPSGVEYGRLIELGREIAVERAPRRCWERVLRRAMNEWLSRPRLFGAVLRAGRGLRAWLPEPLRNRIPPRPIRRAIVPRTRHARRVVLLEGCVQPGLAPGINAAAAVVLDRLAFGIEPVLGEQCCGAMAQHMGHTDLALRQMRGNVERLCAALDSGAEAIVSTASACGLMVKDYGRLMALDPVYSARARRVSAATRDLAEFIDPADFERLDLRSRPTVRVAWQSPCTLLHGQRISGRVETLLVAAGAHLAATGEPALCCGSAGAYSILQPELSRELRRRKLAALLADDPEVIATANVGCLEHLRAASPVPVRHWIEVVAEVLAGGAD